MFFKYYYDFVLLENDIDKLVQCLSSAPTKVEIYKKYLKYLKTNEEKHIFNILSIYYSNIIVSIKYLDFNKIDNNTFYNFYYKISKDFNVNHKDLSYYINIIIKKAIDSKHFKDFLNEKSNQKVYMKYIYGYNNDNKSLYMLPYIKETRDISNPKINYLYIKLKMFINKIRMNKNIKRDIMFKPVLFELLNYYSIKNEYNILKENTIKINKEPVQLMLPGEIELLNDFIIREKADGELVYKLPNNIQPPFNLKCSIKAEYIESLDLYLVFDCNLDMNIIDKYNFIRSKHYITSDNKIETVNSMSQLIKLIKSERVLFDKFMNIDYDHFRWYPKAAWNIITMDKQFITEMYNFINETSIYNNIILSNEYYENDGFIISQMRDNKEIKIKPKSLMTLDLEYTGKDFIDREKNIYDIKINNGIIMKKGIYRCYPDKNNFIAKEIRYDKKKANPYEVINNIINLAKINYTIKNPIYYHDVKYKNNKFWKKIVDDNKSNLINVNNFMYKNQDILDLGCGRSKLLKINIDYITYTGYDNDMYVLLKNIKNIKNKSNRNMKFNYVDLSGYWDKTKDKIYDVIYDKYMNIYAINSLMHFNTDEFWYQINKVSQKGTRFLFNILQSNTGKEIYWIENNSYIKQNNKMIELYFENVHSKPLSEKYITIKDIEKYLKEYNFNIIYKYSSNNDNITDLYDWYVCEKTS